MQLKVKKSDNTKFDKDVEHLDLSYGASENKIGTTTLEKSGNISLS